MARSGLIVKGYVCACAPVLVGLVAGIRGDRVYGDGGVGGMQSRTAVRGHTTLNASTAHSTYQLTVAGHTPACAIIKAPAFTGAGMKAHIDPDGVPHHGGNVVFPVDMYDMSNSSCAGTTSQPTGQLRPVRQAPTFGREGSEQG